MTEIPDYQALKTLLDVENVSSVFYSSDERVEGDESINIVLERNEYDVSADYIEEMMDSVEPDSISVWERDAENRRVISLYRDGEQDDS